MTLATTANRMDYTGNNCTKAYAYTFKVLAESDLDVFVNNVQKTLTTDYTISGVGADTGGTVTFVTAPGCNLNVALVRDIPYTQATDYPENSAFPASAHEDALDKLTMLVQQVKEFATRTWRFAAGSSFAAAGYQVDEPSASKYPRIKSDCSGIEFVALTSCGTYADPVTTKGDLIQGGDTGGQERLAISATFGDLLRVGGAGKAVWATAGLILTNTLDAQADAGKLFAISATCDKAFLAADVHACTRIFGATGSAINDDCQGILAFATGPVRVTSIGAIARGDYLVKATAAGAVQAACTRANMVQYRPVPRGALGVALSANSADCVDMLVFAHPSNGAQGLATVRGNKSQSNTSTANSVCTKIDMLADSLVLADSCNDVVVVRSPGSITNDVTVDNGNNDNGRDQSGAFSVGDIHFYWTYEATSGRLKTRSSAIAPCDRSGPTLPTCETHWGYSHSAYWDGICVPRHSVRGRRVFYECRRNVLLEGTTICETRVSVVQHVPLAATRYRVLARVADTQQTVGTAAFYVGSRLNCILYELRAPLASAADQDQYVVELELPNYNQEFFYRGTRTPFLLLTVDVLGYDVLNGDS